MDIDTGDLTFQLKDQNLFKQKCFINGEWVESESKRTFETLNPEHNEPWAVVPEASLV